MTPSLSNYQILVLMLSVHRAIQVSIATEQIVYFAQTISLTLMEKTVSLLKL